MLTNNKSSPIVVKFQKERAQSRFYIDNEGAGNCNNNKMYNFSILKIKLGI